MNINFELYRIFYVVANNENITKAANELLISQPAITKSIKLLEEQLGGTLFIRTRRGVTLTEEGKEFYKYIKQAIDFINSAENKFSDLINLEVGTIKIGISTTLTKEFLMTYLKIFHKKYPKIQIKIFTNIAKELMPMLRNGLVDIVILNMLYKEEVDDISITPCRSIQDCFAVSAEYTDLIGRKVDLKELVDYPVILQHKKTNTRDFVDKYCLDNGVNLVTNIELASYSLVIEMTKAGFGVGYATKDYIKKELEEQTLYEVDIIQKIPSRQIGYALCKRNVPSFSTNKLIELIKN